MYPYNQNPCRDMAQCYRNISNIAATLWGKKLNLGLLTLVKLISFVNQFSFIDFLESEPSIKKIGSSSIFFFYRSTSTSCWSLCIISVASSLLPPLTEPRPGVSRSWDQLQKRHPENSLLLLLLYDHHHWYSDLESRCPKQKHEIYSFLILKSNQSVKTVNHIISYEYTKSSLRFQPFKKKNLSTRFPYNLQTKILGRPPHFNLSQFAFGFQKGKI